MADGAPMDQKAHEATYSRFIGLAKTGTVICALIAALVVFLISR
ncbi:aa3-type cytochrome c oxidase subunit IV [Sphingomonas sp. BIUV-7]|uniref:Aa3-type cytochrome c oxidase subunit IV n=1 Tax=Sphingomonas natans TaxID=3063330 RepID=A0ABT8YF59_9SPHN|nr:aa3-type cytochrome c oxidase subunit IV [Sphingomonas sp. BIUV-7]MDO6416443.1 aa3-type cytochrome c oxidase subunit IV [Sphingomonas sp. BIUV-7]